MNLNKLKKTFIIAEIGNNHEGSFDIACKLMSQIIEYADNNV